MLDSADGLQAAPEGFCHIASAKEGQTGDAAGFRVRPDADLRQSVVDEEQLDQQRRIPAEFDIDRSQLLQHRDLHLADHRTQQADQDGKEDAERADPDGQHRRLSVKRQNLHHIFPVHVQRSFPYRLLTALKPFSRSPMISSMCSVPMDSRIVFGRMP